MKENQDTVGICMRMDPPTRAARIGYILFPPRHVELLYHERTAMRTMRDCVVTKITVHLSIIDRIRLLITGVLQVDAHTLCENIVGATQTDSVAFVKPPAFLQDKR